MAHVKKYTKDNMQGLSIHLERKTRNHSNKEIDVSRSHLNYDLCHIQGDVLSRLNNRLDQVYCMKRKDVKACCEWIVTLPQELKNKNSEEQRKFFEVTYDFLANRYGVKNVVAANVHVDETTPHMHFNFIPVVYDKKKKREKVSAKEVLTRKELSVFHQELDDFLKQQIPNIYQKGVLNNDTIGIDDVKILKKYSEELKQKEKNLIKKSEEINEMYNEIVNFEDFVATLDTYQSDFEQSKTMFNKYSIAKEKIEEIFKLLTQFKVEYLNFSNLKKENQNLELENQRLREVNQKLNDSNDELREKYKETEKDKKYIYSKALELQNLNKIYDQVIQRNLKINAKEFAKKIILEQKRQKTNKNR